MLPKRIPGMLTRKDIARRIGQSVDVVRRNERQLGILPFRKAINSRLIVYREAGAQRALARRGLV
jgi:hypothetical protein